MKTIKKFLWRMSKVNHRNSQYCSWKFKYSKMFLCVFALFQINNFLKASRLLDMLLVTRFRWFPIFHVDKNVVNCLIWFLWDLLRGKDEKVSFPFWRSSLLRLCNWIVLKPGLGEVDQKHPFELLLFTAGLQDKGSVCKIFHFNLQKTENSKYQRWQLSSSLTV